MKINENTKKACQSLDSFLLLPGAQEEVALQLAFPGAISRWLDLEHRSTQIRSVHVLEARLEPEANAT